MTLAAATTELSAKCLGILRQASAPIAAADLAGRLGLEGSRESQRRAVREVIRDLRMRCGAWIVASLADGYWLTEEETIWRGYNESRFVDARRILSEASRRKKTLQDGGQSLLFDLRPAGYQ